MGDNAYISGEWYNFMESYDYDSNLNKIHTLCRNGSEYWFEYDYNGHRIHSRSNAGFERW